MSRGCLTLVDTIPESMTHIIEPVAEEVLHYIVNQMGLAERFQDNVELVSDFRTTSQTKDTNNNVKLRRDRVRARLLPNVNPSSNKWEGNGTTIDLGNGNQIISNPHAGSQRKTPWSIPKYPDQKYSIFYDDENYITLTEHLVGSTLSMEVSMEFDSSSVAVESLSKLYATFTNGDMINSIDLQYDYPIPGDIQKTLVHLFHLRGKHGEKDSCLKWVVDNSNGNITCRFNRHDPKKSEVVVNKNHFETVFQIECSAEAPTKLEPHGYGFTFTVTTQYARANRMVLQYPIIVNNHFVDTAFVPMNPEFCGGSTPPDMMMWQNSAVTQYWLKLYKLSPRPYKYPWYDPWNMPVTSIVGEDGFKPIVSCAFELDNTDQSEAVTELDLVDGLPGIRLSPEILAYIEENKNKCLGTDGTVNVSVFADDWTVSEKLLDLSDGKTLKINKRRTNSVCRLVVSVRPEPKKGTGSCIRVWLATIVPTAAGKERPNWMNGFGMYIKKSKK